MSIWKIFIYRNDIFKQFCFDCGYVPAANNEDVYMAINELLNVVKSLVQTTWVECFQFESPKVFPFFQK